MIVVVSPERAALDWHLFEPIFRKSTDTTFDEQEPIDILRDVLNGEQIMWAAWDKAAGRVDAVITTMISERPKNRIHKRVCKVVYIAGDNPAKWMPELIETIEKYAKEKGCTAGEGYFRRGWARVWTGAEERGVTIFKDLTK